MAAVAGAAHLLPPLPARPWPWLSARLDFVPYSKYSPAFSDASSDQVDGRNTPHAALTRPPDKSRLLLQTFSPQLLALLPTLCLLLPDGGGCLHAFDLVHFALQSASSTSTTSVHRRFLTVVAKEALAVEEDGVGLHALAPRDASRSRLLGQPLRPLLRGGGSGSHRGRWSRGGRIVWWGRIRKIKIKL